MKALRHKTEPASAASAAPTWWPLANANVYRLIRPPEGELHSGPMWLSGGVYPVLRVQTHPLQLIKVGDDVAVEVDTAQCSVFRRDGSAAAS